MAGTTEAHNDIKFNLTMWLGMRLPTGCRLFGGDVKLEVKSKSEVSYYYPDIFISCDARAPREYVRRDASLVVEVLSPSTERIDRGEKFHAYMAMPSVTDYMLVSQDGASIELFRRKNTWKREVFGADDVIALDAIAHPLPVAEIYRDIPF